MLEGKRVFDLVFAIILIVLLSPVLAGLYLLVLLTCEGTPIFKQRRMGKDQQEFYIYKFRTMKPHAPNMATKEFIDADHYMTCIGKLLRKTSLDELPQLFNILNGTMSFVGPRPVILEEKELIEMRSLNGVYCLMPGLTGWAQVNGRDDLENEEKVRLDTEYVYNRCLMMDMKIMLMTFIKVFRQEGIRCARPCLVLKEAKTNYGG